MSTHGHLQQNNMFIFWYFFIWIQFSIHRRFNKTAVRPSGLYNEGYSQVVLYLFCSSNWKATKDKSCLGIKRGDDIYIFHILFIFCKLINSLHCQCFMKKTRVLLTVISTISPATVNQIIYWLWRYWETTFYSSFHLHEDSYVSKC